MRHNMKLYFVPHDPITVTSVINQKTRSEPTVEEEEEGLGFFSTHPRASILTLLLCKICTVLIMFCSLPDQDSMWERWRHGYLQCIRY